MADARLVELVDELVQAAYDFGSWTVMGEKALNDAKAALVAHVEAREVELMALCRVWTMSPYTEQEAVTEWRALAPNVREQWRTEVRALRDAWDKGGANGDPSANG